MKAELKDIVSKSILTPGVGQLDDFTHSLNPYAGCTFACSYCYVRQLPISLYREEEWGTWVDIKTNAADLLRQELSKARRKGPVTIFMASSTDPYQPLEHETKLTRSLLEVMLELPPDFLHVQTRSPLVKRDIDLFKQFGDHVRVSMTIETDKEDIRKAFAPTAPPIPARMQALREIKEAGITTQASLSPLLPCSKEFPQKLKPLADRVTIDDFWMGDGSGGKRTERLGISDIYRRTGMKKWYNPSAYKVVLKMMQEQIGDQVEVMLSKDGFTPIPEKREAGIGENLTFF
ncbi:Radical SAM superfamily protein [Fictibacillus solisalsi]|uniref:Radical SAM superfamily protein n=1 Tax=Fictibacillus solisalsi TaxID=459525 RepID=A0A1H0A5N9_9BACL|nr:radical SAM protein [Fictibacillus solisalsi]SDN28056.1 Radical SAM superfamily protein [Fictibacillus solisalsi]